MNVDRIVVETWEPSFGAAYEVEDAFAQPSVDLDVETPAARWAPVDPPADAEVDEVVFIDGVQRVDARVTLIDGSTPVAGMAGSFAAGSVRCTRRGAAVEQVLVRRGLFSRASDVALDCSERVRYAPYGATDTNPEALVAAMNEQMRGLEKLIATEVTADLVVIDGPLSGARPVPSAVGLVKSHRRPYLDGAQLDVVAALRPGQRTPLFLTRTSYSRFTWYQRLPGSVEHAWSGIVRCEASGDLALSAVKELAARASATLPRFASTPHRDARAPQNLTPIGALERHLRHRLGDPAVLERLLRRTCAVWSPSAAGAPGVA